MGRPRGRPAGGEAGQLRRRIINAAAKAFAKAGYEGARIETIAREAGCNRALVYFYFGDKGGLFEAVLDAGAENRGRQMDAQPHSLAEALVYWFRQNMAEPERIRLVMQEALADRPQSQMPARRAAYLEAQLAAVKGFQDEGLLRTDIDPRHLLTAILALTSFPAAFPRVAQVALDAAGEEALISEWSQALTQAAAFLSPPSKMASAAKRGARRSKPGRGPSNRLGGAGDG